MDKLAVASLNSNPVARSDLFVGPQEILSMAYGVSLMLPQGWIAGTITNELYGIESLSALDGRICVMGGVPSLRLRENMLSQNNELDMGFIKLSVTSPPSVNANKVTVHGSVQGAGQYKHALVINTVTPKNNTITFAAFFGESAALIVSDTANELADSVRDWPVQ